MNAENLLSTKIKIIISMIISLFILLIASINSLAVKPDKIIEETIIPVKPKITRQISPRRIVPDDRLRRQAVPLPHGRPPRQPGWRRLRVPASDLQIMI